MSQSEHKLEILALIKEWKKQHQKIVFTNGVFDILHVGHVDYLEKAKSLGDKLVVAVNSDDSVRRLNKAPERPINPEFARVKIISALKCVDAAFIFNEDTPLEIIQEILPDVLVKGGDYDASETDQTSKKYIAGSAEVKANGGAVVTIDLVQGFSTTGIVERMRKG
jgi:D-glycero-beta-D-manno-heptose 1-phosphate adenylyltransferase